MASVPVRPVQSENAWPPIAVTELGIVSVPDKPLQPSNAEPPMEVTEFEMVTEVRLLHSRNASVPIVVTV